MNKPEDARGFAAVRPNVQMAFACENVTNEAGGPVSFQNIMDGIGAPEFPATTGRWFAVFCFFGQVEQTITNCRVVVAHENGDIVAQTALKDMTFAPGRQISRNVIAFAGLAWPHPGLYFITFIANRADVLASFPMVVQQTAPDERAAHDAPARSG